MPTAVIRLRKEPHYRRAAFEAGLKRLGYTCVDGGRGDDWFPQGPDDLLVLWNKKAGLEERMADTWEARGGTVIVTENAYLQKVDKSMYAISTHGHNGSGWFPENTDERFHKLGIAVKDWRPTMGGHWLVCGQRSIGSSSMRSPIQWGEKEAKSIGAKTKVKFRPHPGNFAPKIPLLHDLEGAQNCVVWSSSAAVTALVEGVPVYYAAPHWICSDSASRLSDAVDWGWALAAPHKNFERYGALEHMAHGQWTVAEIESGEPFARMKAENWGPRTWR